MLEKQTDFTESNNGIAELVTRTEYDVQISTAKKYPRSIKQFINTAMEMVTLNTSIADECIYALPRDGKTIEGPSARFAEIIVSAWGHARSGARIVAEDDKWITAQGVCHDLQNNSLITIEIRRRITNKQGKRFNDDMVGVTGNAASSIALRQAILKVIPKAFWSPIYEEARKVVMGDAKTLVNRRADALAYLQKFGATQEMVIAKLGVKGAEDITLEHLVTLKGFATAMKDGEATVEKIFAKDEPATTTTGNEAVKEQLKKKQTEKQEPIPQNTASNTKPKPEATPETSIVIELVMPDGQVWQYPTADITTEVLLDEVGGMIPPDAKEFVRNNIDAFPKIIEFMRANGKQDAAVALEKMFNQK